MTHRQLWKSLACACGLTLLTACGTTAPTRFYTLEPDSDISLARSSSANVEDLANLTIAVGPFRFAEYLDRPNIVSRRGRTELDFADFDRWAAPLPANFQRTIAANLAAALQSKRILEYPTTLPFSSGYQVTGRVTRFDTEAEGRAVLTVQWGIRGADGEVLRPAARARYENDGSGRDYAARVRAQSATVAAFSRDIVNTILDLQGKSATSDRP